MASLGSLVVSMAVDTARFQGDLGRAAQVAESRMRNIKDTASRALGIVTVAATAAGAALTAMLRGAISRADDMRDFAQAAGVTVEQLSRLTFAGKQSGVEVEQIVKALAKLSKDGVPDANAALASIADRFAGMPDGAEKTALAIEYFGEKLGPYLIPLLNEGAAGLKKFAEQSDAVGNTIRTSAAAAADEFNDKLGLLRATVDGLSNSLAEKLLPVLNAIADQMVNAATKTGDLDRLSEQLATGMKILIDVGYSVYKTLDHIGSALGALAAAAVAAVHGDFSRAGEILKEANADQIESERQANAFLDALWEDRETQAARAQARLRAITRGGGSEVLARQDAPVTAAAQEAVDKLEKARNQMIAAGTTALESLETPAEHVRRVFDETRLALERMLDLVPEKAPMIHEALARLAADSQQQLDDLARPKDGLRDLGDRLIDSVATPAETIRRNFEEAKIALTAFMDEFPERAPEAQEALERIAAISDEQLEALKRSEKKTKESTDKMSVYAEQAARNMQDAFADFLFDPFDKGLRGMLKGFIDILRRMIAEAAAAKIFESFGFGKAGGGGGGGVLGGILGGLFGGGGGGAPGSTPTVPRIGGGGFGGFFASGGHLNPGEWGIAGEDGPELAFGGAHGQTIVPLEKSRGESTMSVVVNIANNIDMRHSTPDAMKVLPAMFKRNNELMKADIESTIITGIRRRRYDLGV